MSTRCTVLVKKDDKSTPVQYYHHTDGYPEYMGKLLTAFLYTSKATNNWKNRDNVTFKTQSEIFSMLLKKEGNFELEKYGLIHGDIEYIWLVNIDRDEVSFVNIRPFQEDVEKVFKELEEYNNGNKLNLAITVM